MSYIYATLASGQRAEARHALAVLDGATSAAGLFGKEGAAAHRKHRQALITACEG